MEIRIRMLFRTDKKEERKENTMDGNYQDEGLGHIGRNVLHDKR